MGTIVENQFQELCDLFQDYAPESVLVPPLQEHISSFVILSKGELFVGNPIQYQYMKPNSCHDNVLQLYADQNIDHMCVGYALPPDRKWRYHSWGLQKDGTIVETTAPFLLYFGCVMVPLDTTGRDLK